MPTEALPSVVLLILILLAVSRHPQLLALQHEPLRSVLPWKLRSRACSNEQHTPLTSTKKTL